MSKSASRTPSNESASYSSGEIEEMKGIFNKYDTDGSGYLNTTEFTKALQLMDYRYNESFVIEILKLVFDEEWEEKKSKLIFEDFLDFMAEFEPVHYDVIEKIENKMKQENISDIDTDDPRITNLLKYVQFKNGSLLLNEVDKHLHELNQQCISNPAKPKTPNKLGIQSPFKKQPLQSPSLASINENDETQTLTIHNAEILKQIQSDADLSDGDAPEEQEEKHADLASISNHALSDQFRKEQLNGFRSVLKMSNEQLIEWINMDKTFNTTMIRKECAEIIRSQLWTGNDMVQALKSNKIDEILILFKNLTNYEYIIQSLKNFNVKCLYEII